MNPIKKEDVLKLATLARIELTPAETESFATDMSSILDYVSEINKITGSGALVKEVGALYNVMREDTIPHAEGLYTEDLLKAAPFRDGQYLEVKKILEDNK
jgi:aspartyl-tRNA(Asn)/glutamyl-tRNA(Gln) amidotransferase subunit C